MKRCKELEREKTQLEYGIDRYQQIISWALNANRFTLDEVEREVPYQGPAPEGPKGKVYRPSAPARTPSTEDKVPQASPQ